jgi:hypothetical protein
MLFCASDYQYCRMPRVDVDQFEIFSHIPSFASAAAKCVIPGRAQ